ncbi:primosomal protein N' [Spirulina sp. CS-785/01]|uniref:primosomal protein N' n=1 Tax=Spirulina sp. CS-785/01 TaxID=3021716 RepID=UPI00232CF92C|nr:primosomal protein N' [Spirulina sp. CS-785/01]MDB9314559.1 primosomal protein N' [Spirulina sp. CS-785/01]
MLDSSTRLSVAEPSAPYDSRPRTDRWVEVLVDAPGGQGLYTYRCPPTLTVQVGDVVNVPFGAQRMGGIVIREVATLPAHLSAERVRDIAEIVTTGFFPPRYWQWLEEVAEYYLTSLIVLIRTALPPGLLQRSQRRIRLTATLPPGAETFCSPMAQQVLAQLRSQKDGDYSSKYLQRKIKGAERGIQDLIKRGWAKSYLEPPKPPRPKEKKAVTLVVDTPPNDLTQRQQEALTFLQRNNGEMWLSDLLQQGRFSSSIITGLEKKGCVVIQYQEILRLYRDEALPYAPPKALTPAQQQALNTIQTLTGFAPVLLHGVTGSGKTEIYLQAIAPILKQGKSAIVLVPEIGLTPQLTDRFRARFGEQVCVYHSALSDGERYDTWRQMLTGEPQVIIGTRSAIFVPLPHIGIIILDEEHDHSFKQNQPTPTYHARTVAQWRAQRENCPLVLGSATPSLDTWVNIPPSSPHHLSLPERINGRPFPPIHVVDMRQELKRGNRSIFSESLRNALNQLKANNQRGILFIPRRGHSSFVSCRSCGYVIECPHCDISLSYHHTHDTAAQLLRCHFCNYTQLHPPQCPECSSPFLKFFGTGTQRVIRELGKHFPELRAIRFDSDTTRTKGAHRALLSQFTRGEADLLVGTQMLTKGLDIEQVTLVGIVSADGLLNIADYRASERAFQTLTQVSGRAGRGNDPGQVILQTYTPDHPVIHAVKQHNYAPFAEEILEERASLFYPPYGRLVLLRLSGLDGGEVEVAADTVAQGCHNLLQNYCEYQLLGPAPAKIMRINRQYRWHILLKLPNTVQQLPDLSALARLCPQSVKFFIDVDPLSLD